MRSDTNWNERTVLITGGASGIGKAAAKRFADEGARVAIADIEPEIAEAAAEAVRTGGGQAVAIAGDVSLEADVKRIVSETVRAFGGLDVLVNSAAVCPQIKLTDLSLDQWNRVISTNLTAVFLTCREAVPHLLARGGGSIVNIASVHAIATLDGYSAYSASKGGVVALTRAIALDFARDNIRVNAVLPGAIQTPMLEASVKNLDTPREQIMKQWGAAQPVGRVGQPEEVAEAVFFAADPRNAFMTGASLVVDGGMTIDL